MNDERWSMNYGPRPQPDAERVEHELDPQDYADALTELEDALRECVQCGADVFVVGLPAELARFLRCPACIDRDELEWEEAPPRYRHYRGALSRDPNRPRRSR